MSESRAPATTSRRDTPRYDSGTGVTLARRLGPFDATMIVMGGIIGSGIFMNPSVVARQVSAPALILGVWAAGGAIALIGAFVYAELAALRPGVGGQYAYLRDAFHPMVAFLYGWTLLLVVQSGGMAAVSMTFAFYLRELSSSAVPVSALPATVIAVGAIAVLTAVNCFGVRAGSNVQNAFMLLKLAAILALVTIGWLAVGSPREAVAPAPGASPENTLPAALAAMVPVLFAYGGWQTASFVSGELKNPARDLGRGLIAGVIGVVVLYLAVNLVSLRALGPDGLAATSTPASDVMGRALGAPGARLIAAGIAISTLGFLSQGMLTAPRVYYAMARDGVFFRAVGWLDPRTHAPAVAIVLQGVLAALIALSGEYESVVNYVVAIDTLFFGLTGVALIVLRRRARLATAGSEGTARIRTPGHPVTTGVFVAAFFVIALSTVMQFPRSAGIGVVILLAGVPAYLLWRRRSTVSGG